MNRYYFQFKWGRHSGFRYADAADQDEAISFLELEFSNRYGVEENRVFKLINSTPLSAQI